MSKLNIKYKITNILYIMSCIFCLLTKAQDKTISSGTTSPKGGIKKHKIMLIPFENRMYLSEIDFMINKESKLSAKEIKSVMRDGINDQLYKKLKPKMTVVDLLEDTVNTKKDLQNIYQYLSYQYQPVPDQSNYKPPVKEKNEKAIEKGQLNIESKSGDWFMNAKLKNATLVPYLHGKYKTDLFLFINELDIKSLTGPAANMTLNSDRKIIMHYTIYTYDAKEVNSGTAEVALPFGVNNPTKIINTYFSQLAEVISARIEKALMPLK